MALEKHPNYSAVNGSAHRKPPTRIGVPSIIQHYAFWKPDDINDDPWRRNIDHFLLNAFIILMEKNLSAANSDFQCLNYDKNLKRLYLCRNYCDINLMTTDQTMFDPAGQGVALHETGIEDRAVRYEYFSASGFFENIYLTIRAELRHEFWTVTFVGDFSRSQVTKPKAKSYFEHVSEINRKLKSAFDSEDQYNRDTYQDEVTPIYYDFEEMIRNSFFQFNHFVKTRTLSHDSPRTLSQNGLGKIFADFRGLVLGGTTERNDTGGIIYRPLHKGHGSRRFSLIDNYSHPPFDKPHDLKLVDCLLPLIDAVAKSRGGSENERNEFCVSKFHNNRLIYAGSLGSLRNVPRTEPEPIKYLILVNHQNRWQIGRFIESIHNMGNARLAALWDIAKLQKASEKLDELNLNYQNGMSLATDMAAQLKSLIAGREFGLTEGLFYRIERSDYYTQTLRGAFATVPSEHVGGFQKYDEFIIRRMGPTFEFIKNIGVRIRHLQHEINSELNNQRTSSLANMMKDITTVTTSLAATSEAMRRASEANVKLQAQATGYLNSADLIVIPAMSYYIGSVVSDIVEQPLIALFKRINLSPETADLCAKPVIFVLASIAAFLLFGKVSAKIKQRLSNLNTGHEKQSENKS